MKLKVQKDLLQRKLSNIQSIVDRGGSLQILNHFLLDANNEKPFIMATDLETAYKEPIDMEIEEEGKICIHGKKFFEIIKEMEGTIALESIENKWINITSGRSLIRLACLPYEDFPLWPDLEGEREINLSMSQLLKIIERSLYAAKDTEARFFLNGLLFKITPLPVQALQTGTQTGDGILTVVGTDTHRLALVKCPVEVKDVETLTDIKNILISKKAISEIKKILSDEPEMATITVGKNHVLFKIKEIELLTRQIEGTFPNYEQAIPESFEKELIADRNEFLKSLRKVSVISKERGYTVKLAIEVDSMIISANDPDYGEATDEINVNYTAEPLAITFNARYLQEAVTTMSAERIVLKFIEPLKPVMLQQEGLDDYKCVIMPLRS